MDRNSIIEWFKLEFGSLIASGLRIEGFASLMDITVISVVRPFVFDRRLLPEKFEDYYIRSSVDETTLPLEFQIPDRGHFSLNPPYIWAPERFEKYVDRCSDEIRATLGNEAMTREEMLDALIGGSFQEHKQRINGAVANGELPAYIE